MNIYLWITLFIAVIVTIVTIVLIFYNTTPTSPTSDDYNYLIGKWNIIRDNSSTPNPNGSPLPLSLIFNKDGSGYIVYTNNTWSFTYTFNEKNLNGVMKFYGDTIFNIYNSKLYMTLPFLSTLLTFSKEQN